jgi:hypothetical protein
VRLQRVFAARGDGGARHVVRDVRWRRRVACVRFLLVDRRRFALAAQRLHRARHLTRAV